MTTNRAVYHNNCFLKYSDSKLKCFNEPSKKWKSTEDEKGWKSTRFSAESREIDLIYSVVGVVKRTLMLILSLDMNISDNKINQDIKSRTCFMLPEQWQCCKQQTLLQ